MAPKDKTLEPSLLAAVLEQVGAQGKRFDNAFENYGLLGVAGQTAKEIGTGFGGLTQSLYNADVKATNALAPVVIGPKGVAALTPAPSPAPQNQLKSDNATALAASTQAPDLNPKAREKFGPAEATKAGEGVAPSAPSFIDLGGGITQSIGAAGEPSFSNTNPAVDRTKAFAPPRGQGTFSVLGSGSPGNVDRETGLPPAEAALLRQLRSEGYGSGAIEKARQRNATATPDYSPSYGERKLQEEARKRGLSLLSDLELGRISPRAASAAASLLGASYGPAFDFSKAALGERGAGDRTGITADAAAQAAAAKAASDARSDQLRIQQELIKGSMPQLVETPVYDEGGNRVGTRYAEYAPGSGLSSISAGGSAATAAEAAELFAQYKGTAREKEALANIQNTLSPEELKKFQAMQQ